MNGPTAPSPPEVLLFDLGGVLVDFAGFDRLNALLAEPLSASGIRSRWLASEPVREFELGNISPAEFSERVVAEWELPVSPEEFLRAFGSWFRGFYPGVHGLLTELRGRYHLVCLSNSNRVHWESAGAGVAPYFDAAFLSFEVGLAKPDPAIFKTVVSALGVEPHEVLFFDDSEANVEAAVGEGLQAQLVHGPEEVRARLAERGMIAPAR